MQKVYFISGLGADSRSFGFLDLSFCEPHFIQWVAPAPGETLASYAEKLFLQINDKKATIVGLSFGGMLAVEMAKKHPDTRVIIVSSAKTYREIPAYLRFWRHLPVYKLNSHAIQKYGAPLILNIIGTRGSKQQKVQQQILKDTDPYFTGWAMGAIVNWRNTEVPPNVTHIHGTGDMLLPYRFVKADHTVSKGRHVMIMDDHHEVTQLLKQLIVQ